LASLTPIFTFFACYITAIISGRITTASGFAPVIWPPLGIAIAGLVLETRKTLPLVFLAAALGSYHPTTHNMGLSLLIAACEAGSAFFGARTLKQLKNFDWTFSNTKSVWNFITRTVIPTSVITPIIGTSSIYLAGSLHGETITQNFVTWWLGDALGILIFTPFVLIVAKDDITSNFKGRKTEYLVLNLIGIIFCFYLFVDFQLFTGWMPQVFRRIYILFPLTLWAALRFGPVGISFLLLEIAAMATFGASRLSAVFVSPNIPETYNSAQLYMGFLAVTGLLVAANSTQSRRNELQFRSMFEMAGVPSTLVDTTGKFKLVNEQFCHMTGYTQAELSTMTFSDITHPEDIEDNMQIFQRLVSREERSVHFEKRYIIKNGDVIWVLVDATILNHHAHAETTCIAIIQDITARKLATLASENAQKKAETANLAKSEFLAFMSHEIRTPLGVILGFAELLKNEHLDQKLRFEFTNTIHRNAIELGALIDDVLDLSKVEAGKLDIGRDNVNVTELMRDIESTFSAATKIKGVELDVAIAEDVPSFIYSDHKRLRQILMNIVGNAVKFTEHGRIFIYVNREADTDSGGDYLRFTIRDTGLGITPSQAERLFQPFIQSHVTLDNDNRGTGLGLVLSRRLARLMGGDVILTESKLNVGSTFVVKIECYMDNESSLAIPSDKKSTTEADKAAPSRLDGLRILVAEDTPDQALLIKFLLSDLGAHVEITDNGATAVEKSLKNNFDVVFMDIQMPILDGLSATRLLRRQRFQKPIIAITAQALQEDRDKALAAGCNYHLAKPFTQERLLATVRDVLSVTVPAT
jgi:PAS domain S-box-containing protein